MKGLVIVLLLAVTVVSGRRFFRPPCPPNKPQVFCFVDPCMFATCPAFPTAVCRSDFCGGCNAIWSVGGQDVNCDQQVVKPPARKCPPEDLVNCFVDPCRFARCPANPGAVCRSNYCGGCNAEWYDVNGQSVDCYPAYW